MPRALGHPHHHHTHLSSPAARHLLHVAMTGAALQFSMAVLLLLAAGNIQAAAGLDWSSVDAALQDEVSKQSFPGAVAGIALDGQVVYLAAHGSFTFGRPTPVTGTNPPMAHDSLFDMASLTKVLATTTAVMQLYQRGLLHLETPVADPTLLGPAFAAHGKGPVTVRNLMLHNAGFPPDPVPGFWEPAFGCAESAKPNPRELFNCQARIFDGVLNQTLINPVGARYVYSDLSMITAMFVVGTVVQRNGLVAPSDLLEACMSGADSAAQSQCYYEVRCAVRSGCWSCFGSGYGLFHGSANVSGKCASGFDSCLGSTAATLGACLPACLSVYLAGRLPVCLAGVVVAARSV